MDGIRYINYGKKLRTEMALYDDGCCRFIPVQKVMQNIYVIFKLLNAINKSINMVFCICLWNDNLLKKDRTDASDYQQFFIEILDRYRDYIHVYTDGSRDWNYVACAAVFSSDTAISMRLPDSASIFTAEVWEIIKALEQITDSVVVLFLQTHFRDSKLFSI